jgi:hypothetical protein
MPEDMTAIDLLEIHIALIELIELGLVEQLEIAGEMHYRLSKAGLACADQRRVA